MLALLKSRSEGGVDAPPITLEPGARVWSIEAVEDIVLVGMGLSAVQLMSDVYSNMYREKGKREVWVVNAGAFLYQHDVVFNMRDLTVTNEAGPGVSYLNTYKDHDRPVVTARYVKEIKNCYEFPWELVFGTLNDYYFASSPAYMIAAAMISQMLFKAKTGRFGTVRLYGFDFNYPGKDEYETGRCCVEYWVGRMKQMGITVLLPEITTLCDQSLRSGGRGLQDNGICYGLHDNVPIFGMDKGRIYLKAFRNRTVEEIPPPIDALEHQLQIQETARSAAAVTKSGDDNAFPSAVGLITGGLGHDIL